MNDIHYKELLLKLDKCIYDKKNDSCGDFSSQGVYIVPNMNVEQLSEKQLMLTHTLLHKFYSTGMKSMTKKEIKEVHDRVKNKINHFEFDSLDY